LPCFGSDAFNMLRPEKNQQKMVSPK